jgi:hypothetical protein
MTQENKDREMDLNAAISAVRADEPDSAQLREAAGRVWQNMQAAGSAGELGVEHIRGCADVQRLLPAYSANTLPAERTLLVEAHLRECVTCRRRARHQAAEESVAWTSPIPARGFGIRGWRWAAAAAVILAVTAFLIQNTYFAVPAGARAKVQALDGLAYRVGSDGERPLAVGDELAEGELLRTAAGAHAFVQLRDGSVVEVNERSEFGVKARGKDMTIALDKGAVIVQAAKRKMGHLFVKTPDCRVAVTGTIFSVNSGIKGSRVAVFEGAVQVTHAGVENALQPGDQVATSENMAPVSLRDDIAWSRNLDKHLELLAQFAALRRRLEQVPLPGPRYSSALLERVPADTVLYASIPNLGEALSEANRILQEQMQQSPALREWWTHGRAQNEDKFNETIEKVREVAQYLGDEVVLLGFNGRNRSGMAVIAGLRRSGLREFLASQFPASGKRGDLLAVEEHDLAGLTPANIQGKTVALVRQDEVVFSDNLEALDRVNAQLNAGMSGFEQSEFGQRIAAAYSRGAAFLIAANLHQMIAEAPRPANARRAQRRAATLDRSGFSDMNYLIAEHREVNGVPNNRLVVDFARDRRGIASWLAAPGPMGSLEFVSRNAGLAVAFVAKDPALIFNDVLEMATTGSEKAQREIADAEQKLRLRLREDLAAHFGGDAVLALDGPVLPTPSWKFVIEVHDPVQLQASLEKLVQAGNDEARQHGRAGVELRREDVGGQQYYAVRSLDRGADAMHYTFAAGYMIVAPSRAILMNTLRTRASGDSLARAAEFRALLPKDEQANYSAIAYQNLSPILQPLLSQLSGERAAVVQQLAADARPSVICAWGEQNRIEATSNSRLFAFDWLALGSLLDSGTKHRHRP